MESAISIMTLLFLLMLAGAAGRVSAGNRLTFVEFGLVLLATMLLMGAVGMFLLEYDSDLLDGLCRTLAQVSKELDL